LALQTFLFRLPVAEDVAIAWSHASPCHTCGCSPQPFL
jgi:hypothetical protein